MDEFERYLMIEQQLNDYIVWARKPDTVQAMKDMLIRNNIPDQLVQENLDDFKRKVDEVEFNLNNIIIYRQDLEIIVGRNNADIHLKGSKEALDELRENLRQRGVRNGSTGR